ncbi:MAG: C25 family cysteine peptidase, partial [Limisphaerales bacterium]
MTFCFRLAPLRTTSGLLALGLLAILPLSANAQDVPPIKFSVRATGTVQESPAGITLNWPNEGDANSYIVSRRTLSSGWQQLATLGTNETSFSDSGVSIGTPYEYQIIKNTSRTYTGYGYLRAGIRVPATDQRGKIILLVENGPAAALSSELDRFQNDLIADGWQVIRRNVSMSDSPPSVRETIRSIYNSDPTNVKALLLFGHIAVPYSGDIVPDGHANHRGAWPADVYYGEMDGSWTDRLVNTTIAERAANHNIPSDGKFDQSQIPGEVELMVGRVDLHNMTCFANKANSRSEIDLLRQYLNKNHQFRRGLLSVERRALICDNFGDKGRDPIAGSAWRAFPGAVGSDVEEVGWDGYMPAATSGSYLWSYGSGGGSYYYSSGVGSSDQFALEDVRVVFTMFMGSYFGDWNNESNFLRAALGSGWVLTSSYSGFPQSLYFPMSLGEPIGHCMRITQNNREGGLYPPWSQ